MLCVFFLQYFDDLSMLTCNLFFCLVEKDNSSHQYDLIERLDCTICAQDHMDPFKKIYIKQNY